MISYKLAYGDFDTYEALTTKSERILFLLGTIVMPLVLLNLLIAIMTDKYD